MAGLTDFHAREIALKHARLRAEIGQLPPGTKAATEKTQEARRLQAELRQRLYSFMTSEVLPVLAITNGTIMKNGSYHTIDTQGGSREKGDIVFHFDVFSLLNTRIDRFKVPAPTKEEAWEKARKRAEKYPGQVKLKIS